MNAAAKTLPRRKIEMKEFKLEPMTLTGAVGRSTMLDTEFGQVAIVAPSMATLHKIFDLLTPEAKFDPEETQLVAVLNGTTLGRMEVKA